MPAHHLDDHDAVVRLRGRVEPVDRLGRDRHRRVEAEGVVVPEDRCRSSSGTPTTGNACSRGAARRPRACPHRRSRRARRAARPIARAPSTPPSTLYGFVRVVPRIVPPRGRIPDVPPSERSEDPVDQPAASRRARRHLVARSSRAGRPRGSPRSVRGNPRPGENSDSHAYPRSDGWNQRLETARRHEHGVHLGPLGLGDVATMSEMIRSPLATAWLSLPTSGDRTPPAAIRSQQYAS